MNQKSALSDIYVNLRNLNHLFAIAARQRNFPIMQIEEMSEQIPLVQNYFLFWVFSLIDVVDEFGDGGALEQDVLKVVV